MASSLTRTVSADPESPRRTPGTRAVSGDSGPADNSLNINIYNNTRELSVVQNNLNQLRCSSQNLSRSESSSSESVNSQDGSGGHIMGVMLPQVINKTGGAPPPVPLKPDAIKNLSNKSRQDQLEQRHQELLSRQRQLQVGPRPWATRRF